MEKPWLFKNGACKFSEGVHEKIIFKYENNKVYEIKNKVIHLGDASFPERLYKNISYSIGDYERYLKYKKMSFFKLILMPVIIFLNLIY